MGGLNTVGGGVPQDAGAQMVDMMRRRGLLQALASVSDQPDMSADPQPMNTPDAASLTARMNADTTAAPPVEDPGTQPHRIEDDPVTRNTGGQPDGQETPDGFGVSPSRGLPLREAMNAPIPPPPDTNGLRLRDAMALPSGSPAVLPPTPLTEAQARLAKAEGPSGVSRLMTKAQGISNPFLRGLGEVGAGLARGADVAGSIVAPNYAAMIPGTTLNRAMNIRGAEGQMTRAEGHAEREAQTRRLEDEPPQHMETDQGPVEFDPATRQWKSIMIGGKPTGPPKASLESTAAGRRQLAEQYGLTGEDSIRYILTGQMPVAADKPNLDEQAGQRAQEADKYGLQGAERQRYILTGQVGADKPDTANEEDQRFEQILMKGDKATLNEKAFAKAYERRKTLGPQATSGAADARQAKQQTFENTKEARKAIADAEKQYRNAKEAGDALNGFIDLARSGNKEAAATVPLEGTLRIVTSQGVKRINRTEVEGIEGAGSLFDRIQAKVGKWTEGQPIPPDLLDDFDELTRTLTNAGYQNYSDAYDQARDLYEPAGVDFGKIKKLSAPGQQLKDQVKEKAGGAPPGMVRFQDSQGGIHDIPRGNLEKARKRDPGLQILGR